MTAKDDIDAVQANSSLTPEEKRLQRAIIKRDELQAKIASFLPYTLNIDQNRKVVITSVLVRVGDGDDCEIHALGEFYRKNTFEDHPAWPVIIVNPPLLRRDRTEDIEGALREIFDRLFV